MIERCSNFGTTTENREQCPASVGGKRPCQSSDNKFNFPDAFLSCIINELLAWYIVEYLLAYAKHRETQPSQANLFLTWICIRGSFLCHMFFLSSSLFFPNFFFLFFFSLSVVFMFVQSSGFIRSYANWMEISRASQCGCNCWNLSTRMRCDVHFSAWAVPLWTLCGHCNMHIYRRTRKTLHHFANRLGAMLRPRTTRVCYHIYLVSKCEQG